VVAVTHADPRKCAGCGSAARSFAFTGRDWYLGTAQGRWSYYKCSTCRSVYADPQPTDADLDAAYAASYGPYRDPGLLERLAEPLARREAAWVIAMAGGSGTVLDLGCGTGAMMRRIRESGWVGPIRGVEFSEEVARATMNRLGLPVDVATVETAPIPEAPARIVVLRHVIEHVREPREVLERVREMLESDGLLYLATPDRRALAAAAFGRFWHGYDPPRHLHAFTAGGVRTLLASSGFRVEAERWDFAPQMWAASLHHRLSASRFRRRADPLSSLMNPVVGGLAGVAGVFESLLRRTTLYGVAARRC
jgi:SAM-dependent methyltransferase